MCTGVELGLLLGSAALQGANNAQAQRKQTQIATDAVRRNSALNAEAGNRVASEIQNLKSSTPAAEEQSANADFTEALKRARVEQGGDAFGGPGGDRFASDIDLARTAAGNEGKNTARLLARIDAPTFQRTREATGVNRAATDLGLIGARGQSGDFIDQLRLARAQPDPGIDALASLGGAYGMARAGRMKRQPTNLYTMTPSESADITRGMSPWRIQ